MLKEKFEREEEQKVDKYEFRTRIFFYICIGIAIITNMITVRLVCKSDFCTPSTDEEDAIWEDYEFWRYMILIGFILPLMVTVNFLLWKAHKDQISIINSNY
jgi:hypothetical protein